MQQRKWSCSQLFLSRTILAILVTFAGSSMPALASTEKYALLIGINDYKSAPLYGTLNDVSSMAEVLSDWQFPKENVVRLVNNAATKKGILDAIDKFTQKAKKGDHVFIYYSGHGTSVYDEALNKLKVDLPLDSGAILPYDAVMKGPSRVIKESLIEKYADLLPRWEKFEAAGVNVFVMFDSCYSQNAARSLQPGLKDNFTGLYKSAPLHFDDNDLFEEDFSKSGSSDQPAVNVLQKVNTGQVNFKHILFFAAAARNEKAVDISHKAEQLCPFDQALSRYQCKTYDGKEHGAFSDQFFTLMNGVRPVVSHSGSSLTYGDLIGNIQKGMAQTPFRHTPIAMPEAGDTRLALLSQPVFGQVAPSSKVKFAKPSPKKVYAQDLPESVRNYVKQSPDFSLTTDRFFDYRFFLNNQALVVKSAADETLAIREITKNSTDMMIDYLKWESWIYTLPQKQQANFAVDLTLQEKGIGSRVPMGTSLAMTPSATKSVYAVVIGLLASGELVTLYPNKSESGKRLSDPGAISNKDPVTACGLPGQDRLLMLGFDTPTPAVDWNWDGHSDISQNELDSTLKKYKGKVALKVYPLTTYKTLAKEQFLQEQIACR